MATPGSALIDTGEFEAVSEAELVAEAAPKATATAHRPSADSGVRPSPAVLAARIEAAISASAKTEATLSDLLRTAKFLSASIDAARAANAGLANELEVLCSIVDGDGAERGSLERRIQRLERVAEETSRDAARDRKALLEEHDAFIASLVSDHERELQALRRRLSELENTAVAQPGDSQEPELA